MLNLLIFFFFFFFAISHLLLKIPSIFSVTLTFQIRYFHLAFFVIFLPSKSLFGKLWYFDSLNNVFFHSDSYFTVFAKASILTHSEKFLLNTFSSLSYLSSFLLKTKQFGSYITTLVSLYFPPES